MVQGNESMVIASMWESVAAWFTPIVLFGLMNLIIATIFIASKSTTTKNPNHDNEQDHGYSFGRILRVSSFLDRAKSIKLSSLIPAITTTTIILQPKTVKYDSLSRLAQSIFSVCSYDSQPDSKRYPSSKPKPKPTPSLLGRLKSIDFSSVYIETDSPGQLVRVPSVLDRVKSFKNPTRSESIPRSTVPENVNPDPGHPVIRSKPKKSKSKPNSKVEIKKTRSEVRTVSSDDEAVVVLRRPETARARRNADDDAKADNFISKFREQLKLQRLESLVRYNEMLCSPN